MPTTSNFGWTTPADTDLVKDGASAIRTLGNGIDASLVDLKGGTTGQVLAKASNTDLDFTWATDASGIPATIFDAKGDLIAASAADTAARLAVGSNGQVLTADSTASTGLKWATPAGGKVLQVVQATYGTSTATSSTSFESSGLSASITPSATSSKVLVLVNNWMVHGASGSAYSGSQCRILRGATQIYITNTLGYSSSAQELGWILDMKYLDSPSTTSSTTYSLEYKSLASFTTYIQQGNTTATMILMEIGA